MEGSSESFYPESTIFRSGEKMAPLSVARAASVAIVLFTALTLTHAAFVDYRTFGDRADKNPAQMPYLQIRKFGVMSLTLEREPWSGQVRAEWIRNGVCCGTYEMLVKMRGGPTRIRLLKLLAEPKNKLQLANELSIDWKAADRHVERLLACGLVQVLAVAGTCTVYSITEKGSRALALADVCKK